jgi:hypothetical protein
MINLSYCHHWWHGRLYTIVCGTVLWGLAKAAQKGDPLCPLYMNHIACLLLLVLLSHAAGCLSSTVVVNGVRVPRQNANFTGHPYTLRHVGIHPGHEGRAGGLSDAGGVISGQVCGVDVVFDVTHDQGGTQLVGSLNNEHPSHLRVVDSGGARAITGQLATMVVDLRVRPQQITGYVGRRGYNMRWDGEQFRQIWRVANFGQVALEHRILGKDALWQMPAADQAVLLPLMLACLAAYFEHETHYTASPPPLRFGGPVGALPRDTLVFQR